MADLSIAIEILGKDSFTPVAKGITGALGGLFAGASKLGMGVFGISQLAQGIGSVASGMISGNAQMETYQSQLETLMGSADLAKDRIAQLAQIGADTPFELPQLVASEKILMGFGLTTEKTQKLTGKSLDEMRTSIGDMAAGTGTDLSELTNLWGKFGSGATGEAISRLQELGIVTREQMAEVGIEFSKSGELISPLPLAMEAAMKIADSKFGGGMAKLSQTFEGQMSTLADGFNQAKTAIMSPIFDVLKDSLVSVNQFLAGDTFKAGLETVAGLMAGGVKSAIEGLGEAFMALQDPIQTAQDAFGTIQQVIAGDWSASGSIDPVVAAVGNLATIIRDQVIPAAQQFGAFLLDPLGTNLATVAAALGTTLPPTLAFLSGTAFPALLGAVSGVATTVQSLTEFITGNSAAMSILAGLVTAGATAWGLMTAATIAHTVATQAVAVATGIMTTAQAALNVVMTANPIGIVVVLLAGLAAALITAYNTSDEFRAAVDGAMAGATAAFKATVDFVSTMPASIGGFFENIGENIGGTLERIVAAAAGAGTGMMNAFTNAVTGAAQRAYDAVLQIVQDIADLLPGSDAKTGPLSRLTAMGQALPETFAGGIRQRGTVVGQAVRAVVDESVGGIEGFIRRAAAARGIDPDIAVRVANSEGGTTDPVRQSDMMYNGAREQSFGPFQLFMNGGLGNTALKAGIDPRKSEDWMRAVEFALDEAAKGGWGPWHGAARVGIGNREGLGGARAIGVQSGKAGADSAATQAAVQATEALTQAQQDNAAWAQTMAEQQQALTNTLGQQAPPMRATTDAMAAFGSVLGPIERQVAGGSISLDTLQFKLVDLARATGVATEPWADYNAGLIGIDQAMERVINQSADAGPGFENLRQIQDDVGRSTRQNTLDYLQLALNYQTAKPAIDAVGAATGTAADQTGEATDAVSSLTGKYTALNPLISDSTKLVEDFGKAIGELDSGPVNDLAGSWGGLAGKISDATGELKDYLNTQSDAGGGGDIPHFAKGGVMDHDGLAFLHARERVLPAGASASTYSGGGSSSGGSGGGDVYNIAIDARGLTGSARQMANDLGNELESFFARKKGSNGTLAWERRR